MIAMGQCSRCSRMEYAITLDRRPPYPDAISAALVDADPAAVVDLCGNELRVATMLAADEVLLAIGRAGSSTKPLRWRLLPSICCGGCGG